MEKLSDKLLKRLEEWRARVAKQQESKKPDQNKTNFVSRKDFGDETEEEYNDRRRI